MSLKNRGSELFEKWREDVKRGMRDDVGTVRGGGQLGGML